ncbi:MAG: hypothetical protein NZ580_03900 [Bacteroidia bacterium]|nr:hypothetical protein [Bacteroidia bacterium]MDW8236231.1 CUB domain-containing protein [Bacteroidia bacterium]
MRSFRITAVMLGVGWSMLGAQTCTYIMPTSGNVTHDLTACCGSGAVFLDSGGGSDYADNENGVVTFSAPSGQQVEVRFDTFQVETGYDTLWVHDGADPSAPLLAVLNGVAGGPFMLRSTGNQITFRFKSDDGTVLRGWRATLRCVSSGTACIYTMPATSQVVDLSTANCCGGAIFFDSGGGAGNYGDNEDRTITFQAPAGQGLRVHFGPSFRIAPGDTLYIHNGPNASAPVVAKLSGSPISVSSTATIGQSLTFRFVSNGAGNRAGWIAMVECYAISACNTTMPPIPATIDINAAGCCAGGAVFLDSGGGGNYDNNEDRTITYVAPSGQQIEIRFDTFEVEPRRDTLWVYEGPNTSSPVLAVLTGIAGGPFILRSTGNQVTFRFKSDVNETMRGWYATLRCVTSGTACLYTMPADPQVVDLGAVNCCGAVPFFDSGGSGANYGDNQNRIITFQAPVGQALRVHFGPSLVIAPGDTLFVHDGPDANSPIAAQLVGAPNLVRTIVSWGRFLTFRFVSNSTGTASGWIAMLECYPVNYCNINMPLAILNIDLGSLTPGCCGASGASFHDSGGPTGSYTNNENRIITYTAPAGQYVRLQFTTFNTERANDLVYIYDGPSINHRQINALTGSLSGIPPIISTENSLTIQFFSDTGGVRAGWVSNVRCHNTPGTLGCTFFVPPNTKNDINLNTVGCCSGSSIIYDSGGDAGAPQPFTTDTLILRVSSGRIRISFDTLNLAGAPPSTDTLYIYNGASPTGTPIFRRSGIISASEAVTVTSSGNALTLLYVGKSGRRRLGWKAQATCLTATGVAAPANAVKATLYPNPSTGLSVLETSQPLVHVRVWDLGGRLLWEAFGESTRWELNSPAQGIFLIEGWTRTGEPVHLRWVVE